MKLGIVKGRVVLSKCDPALIGTRFLVIEPVTAKNLLARNGLGGGYELVAADHLGPGLGQMVGFVEGREAANPYYPGKAAVDAYVSLIVETADFRPPSAKG